MPNIKSVLENEESIFLSKPGKYGMAIETIASHRSQSDGKCLRVTMRVTEGEEEGKLFSTVLSLSSKAAFKVRQLVHACGKDIAQVEDTDELIGCELCVVLVQEEWQGELRLKVKSFQEIKS